MPYRLYFAVWNRCHVSNVVAKIKFMLKSINQSIDRPTDQPTDRQTDRSWAQREGARP